MHAQELAQRMRGRLAKGTCQATLGHLDEQPTPYAYGAPNTKAG
jgi:hypothetical protein